MRQATVVVDLDTAQSGGRALLAAADDGEDWRVVRGHLVSLGWQVELLELSALEDPGGAEAALPPLDGLDAAVVVLARSAGPGGRAATATTNRTSHMIGLLQGRLGPSRLVVLVESALAGELAGTGVVELPYSRGEIDTQFPPLRALIGDALAPSPAPVADSVIERLRIMVDEVRPTSWVFLGGPLVLFAVLMVLGIWLLGSGAGAGEPQELVRIRVDLSSLAQERPSSQMPPAGPAVDPGSGGIDALPDRCVLDTSAGADLAPVIRCERGGQLLVQGDPGPWHDRIRSVELDPGVVATVTLGERAGQSAEARVQLQTGGQSLAPYSPELGVDRIELLFAANGQAVVLREGGEGDGGGGGEGGGEATLVFSPPS